MLVYCNGAGLGSLDLSMTPETCQAYQIVVLNVSARYVVGELYKLKLIKAELLLKRVDSLFTQKKENNHPIEIHK